MLRLRRIMQHIERVVSYKFQVISKKLETYYLQLYFKRISPISLDTKNPLCQQFSHPA